VKKKNLDLFGAIGTKINHIVPRPMRVQGCLKLLRLLAIAKDMFHTSLPNRIWPLNLTYTPYTHKQTNKQTYIHT
jgi:hypothetical protein